MVLRIEKVSLEQLIILRLSGRIQSEHVEELRTQVEGFRQKVVLDLADVKLVDRDAISFLAVCEANGVELRQCSPYIRDWIGRERGQPPGEKNRREGP
jgi:anti-anti-sigma regulatory factor